MLMSKILILVGLCCVLVAIFVANYKRRTFDVFNPSNSAVVISGCSSGIGLHTARYLAAKGFLVYAGVRRPSEFELFESEQIVPVLLDVANSNSVAAARDYVVLDLKNNHPGVVLRSIVNNAGIGYLSAVQEINLESFRSVLDVNLIGAVDLVQKFVPLMTDAERGGGRVVNVGSVAGFLSTPLFGAYGASKYALEAVNDALRLEMDAFNVSVSVIQAGTILHTKIRSKKDGLTKMEGSCSDANEGVTVKESPYQRFYEFTRGRLKAIDEHGIGDPPEVVSEAILHAIMSPQPNTHYAVGRVGKTPAWVVKLLCWALPVPVVDWVVLRLMRPQ